MSEKTNCYVKPDGKLKKVILNPENQCKCQFWLIFSDLFLQKWLIQPKSQENTVYEREKQLLCKTRRRIQKKQS